MLTFTNTKEEGGGGEDNAGERTAMEGAKGVMNEEVRKKITRNKLDYQKVNWGMMMMMMKKKKQI